MRGDSYSPEAIFERYPTDDAICQRFPLDFPDDMGRFDSSLHSRYTLFKVRAECLPDLFTAFKVVCDARDPHASTKICEASTPRVFPFLDGGPLSFCVVFASKLSLDTIRTIWWTLDDLHVMVESVAKLEEYTGKRIYGWAPGRPNGLDHENE